MTPLLKKSNIDDKNTKKVETDRQYMYTFLNKVFDAISSALSTLWTPLSQKINTLLVNYR